MVLVEAEGQVSRAWPCVSPGSVECEAARRAWGEGRRLVVAVRCRFVFVPGGDFPAGASVTRPWELPPSSAHWDYTDGADETERYKQCFRRTEIYKVVTLRRGYVGQGK